MYLPNMSNLTGYFYLCGINIQYEPAHCFPIEHYRKQGKVSLFNYNYSCPDKVIVKPRNIYFIYVKLTSHQILQLQTILSTQNWQKHALCDLDLNNYPEVFI